MTRWWTLLLVACIGLPAHAQIAGDGKKEKDRFLQDAPVKWEEIKVFVKSLQGKLLTRAFIAQPPPLPRAEVTFNIEVKQNKTSSLFLQKISGAITENAKEVRQDKEEVFGSNARYSFHLIRRKEGWLLAKWDKNPQATYTPEALTVDRMSFRGIARPFVILDDQLAEIVKNPTFSVKTVESLIRDGKKLVKVEFDYRTKSSRTELDKPGWMILDPERFWCIVQLEVKHRGEIFKASNELALVTNNMPIVKRGQSTFEAPGGESDQGFTEWELHVDANVPDREFTLSAFGLPEPKGVVWDTGGARYHLWLIGAGIGVLLLGILLGRRLRQKEGLAMK